MLDNFDNIQIPEIVKHMPDTDPKIRHIRKWAILIGVPAIAIIIVVAVYILNLQPRQSASQSNNPSTSLNTENNINPSTSGILPSDNSAGLPGAQVSLSIYKSSFDAIKSSLARYDEIFKDVKLTGQCYSSINDGVSAQAVWESQLNSQIGQNIPEITFDNGAGDPVFIEKYNQLKSEYKNYTSEVKVFNEGQQKIYNAWLETNKTIFKVCDSSAEQVVESCKPVGAAVDNYKKLLIKENNEELFSNLDGINSYCSQIAGAITSDDLSKFDQLNESFGKNYQKTISLYPNISDKTKLIKDFEAKISTLLVELI